MKNKAKIILLFFLIILQFSCEDWLELIPPQGLIRNEFWKTKEDVEAVVMGAYETFSKMDGNLFKYGELRGDMVTGDTNMGGDDRKISESNIYSDNGLCNWSQFYQVINYCNEVIKSAPLVKNRDDTFTDFQLQGYLSEVYYLRSLSYFYLVRIFKDVPYVTEPTESDDAYFYLSKMDGDSILSKIVIDLEYYRKFSTIDGYRTIKENKGRITKAAYDALLADIALWRFDYESVIGHVQKIEMSDEYLLLPSAKWFEMYYPGNSFESIFEFQYEGNLGQNNSTYGLTQRYSYNYDPSQKAIEYFAKEFTRELYRGEDTSIKKYTDDDFIIWKYVGASPDGKTLRSGAMQYSCNWIVYRYADVLLMKAEALSQLSRFTEAILIVNEIRARADVPPISIANTVTAFEDAIMEERALELAFEGKRWFDLMRMGRRNNYNRKSNLIEIIIQNVPSTQKRILATKLNNPLGWYLPIHESEIERNKSLIQNPYYNY